MQETKGAEPKVYTVLEVQQMLKMSKSGIYKFLQQDPPFKVIKIGSAYRIPKKSFDAWFQNNI